MGSMGLGVQWDPVTENHVVPVHREMCKYTIIMKSCFFPSREMPMPLRAGEAGRVCPGGVVHNLDPGLEVPPGFIKVHILVSQKFETKDNSTLTNAICQLLTWFHELAPPATWASRLKFQAQ